MRKKKNGVLWLNFLWFESKDERLRQRGRTYESSSTLANAIKDMVELDANGEPKQQGRSELKIALITVTVV